MKAVFFDLDGTLLNTLSDIHMHLNQMLRAFSYPEISEMQTKAYVGDGARRLIERALPNGAENIDECFSYFKEQYEKTPNVRTSLYEGEESALLSLKQRGYLLAVITNKPQAAAERCLKEFFQERTFDFVGGDSGMFSCKPDPSLTRYALLTLRVALKDCVFVGDGEADVLTARNVGIRCISALWGYRTKEQLEKVGAKEFATSFEELVKIL